MSRLAAFVYGVVAYVVFLAVTVYAIGFVGNYHFRLAEDLYFVPRGMDFGGPAATTLEALLIDGVLLLLFAVQHSGMARQRFKRWITRFISPAVERSTYVMATNLMLALLFWQWRPIGGELWAFGDGSTAALVLRGVNMAGWVLVVLSTFLIDHFELFGLRQVYAHARGVGMDEPTFRQPFLYRWTRHPLYLGFLIAFWATPIMTWGHLVFALAVTGYILVAVQFEERDLIRMFGDRYRAYRERVPMLLPRPGSGKRDGA